MTYAYAPAFEAEVKAQIKGMMVADDKFHNADVITTVIKNLKTSIDDFKVENNTQGFLDHKRMKRIEARKTVSAMVDLANEYNVNGIVMVDTRDEMEAIKSFYNG